MTRREAVLHGAAEILAAVKAVDPALRLEALAAALDAWVKTGGTLSMPRAEVTHACPPGDGGFTPCCNRTPFELPRTDRMTLDPTLVTCGTGEPESTPAAELRCICPADMVADGCHLVICPAAWPESNPPFDAGETTP